MVLGIKRERKHSQLKENVVIIIIIIIRVLDTESKRRPYRKLGKEKLLKPDYGDCIKRNSGK